MESDVLMVIILAIAIIAFIAMICVFTSLCKTYQPEDFKDIENGEIARPSISILDPNGPPPDSVNVSKEENRSTLIK